MRQSPTRTVWLLAPAATLVLGALAVSACGDDDENAAWDRGAPEATTIALLLPESKTARYECSRRSPDR
jgi:hypothetical protein